MNDHAAISVSVIGAGGHARVVIATVLDAGFVVSRVVDDDARKHGSRILGVIVEPPTGMTSDTLGCAVVAVGENELRREIVSRYAKLDWKAVVHPSAYVHPSVRIGAGAVVFAGSIIQPGAIVGDHVIINTGVTVDHDCVIDEYAHLGPGTHLAGAVRVGEGAFLGVGCCATPGVTIGSWARVGAGGVVVSDLAEGVTAVGVPARAARV